MIAYHASNKKFDKFSLKYTNSGKHKEQFNALWFSTDKDYIKQFGSIIYKVEIKGNFIRESQVKLGDKLSNEFCKLNNLEDYEDYGMALLETKYGQAFSEFLVEKGYDGYIFPQNNGKTIICFNPECCKIILQENAEVLENPEIIDKSNEKFWKWFNGSKCVDENGDPLKVYHGTTSKFKSFNKKKLGNKDNNIMSFLGFHFTPDYNMADRLFRKSANDEILECYLSIKNPFVCKESDAVKEALKLGYEKGYIDIESNNFDKLLNMEYFNNQDGGLANILAIDGYHAQRGWEHQFDLKAIGLNYLKYLKSQGYDGIKYLNEIEWAQDERYDWIAFEPNQIKSVNAKEFSNSSNIYETLNKEIERYL